MGARRRPDEHELEDHFRQHFPQVVASLTLVVGDRELAHDAAAEAFAKAYSRWSRVSSYRSPTGWIYTVALNRARRAARRRGRERDLLATLPPAVASVSPGDGLGVWELLDTLPERQRTAVVLRYAADLTEADVAAAMGVTRSTVSSQLRAAHAHLADQLDRIARLERGAHEPRR
jgi:RNA polymerase sigma-70 factor (ECF subfamily)